MNHFIHKHRYWFVAAVLIAVVAIFVFQIFDDGGTAPGPVNNPNTNLEQPSERLPIGK
jgi:hypothetical protein